MPMLHSFRRVLARDSSRTHPWKRAISALHMPTRFSADARMLSFLAHESALRARQNCVDTDHLVLAMLDSPTTLALLQSCGTNVDLVRSAIVNRQAAQSIDVAIGSELPRSSLLQKTWEDAHVVADRQHSLAIGPEHLVLALLYDLSCVSKAANDLLAAGFVRPDTHRASANIE